MNRFLCCALTFALVMATTLSAAPLPAKKEAKTFEAKIVNNIINALGDSKEAKSKSAIVAQVEASINIDGRMGQMTGTWTLNSTDQFRAELQMQIMGRTEGGTLVSDGKKVWAMDQRRNKAEEAPEEAVKVITADFCAIRVLQHPYILKDKNVKLSSLGELRIGEQDTVGLRVEIKGKAEIDLYVDKKTWLPVKSSLLVKEGNNVELEHAFIVKDYKKSGPRKHFTKLIMERDGKKTMDMKLTNIELKEKLDASQFEKP